MKRMITLIVAVLLIQTNVPAQAHTKMIELKEGNNEDLQRGNLNVSALLQIYGNTSAAHLVGDIYLRIDNKDETIAEFYVDHDQPEEGYYTKVYKNYFLTFLIENDKKYLIIEQAQFGKAFALSSKGKAEIGNKNDLVEIEITDFVHEWGEEAPVDGNSSSRYDDVHYTIKVKAGSVVKDFHFYSTEVKGNYVVDIENYSILILSDKYKNSSALIEMIINKGE